MRVFLTFTTALFLSGCATTPWTPQQVASFSDTQLCAYAATEFREIENTYLVANELVRRNLMTPQEITQAKTSVTVIGSSECMLLAKKGNPEDFFACGSINTTVGSYGTHKQYVYRDCATKATYYVYVENGVVTGFQN